ENGGDARGESVAFAGGNAQGAFGEHLPVRYIHEDFRVGGCRRKRRCEMTINNNVALENNRPRVDIHQKVTGAAKYTADQYPAKLMYARMIRFPYGKGIVESADLDAARAVPGVLEVELDTSKTYEY